ncbi:hypothetical protein [Xanthomonas phage JGB6]|nr:hypothetical protein [Xanthomonas phage JGB6]
MQELGNKLRADPKLQAVLSLVELTVLYHKIRGVDPEQLRQIEASLIAQQELADIMAANQATKH